MRKDSKTLFGLHGISDFCRTEQRVANMLDIQAGEYGWQN